MGWQPIETAPKDGTPVLLYFRGGMHVGQYLGVWHPDNLRWCVRTPTFDDRDRGVVTDIDVQLLDGKPWPGGHGGPSHWQPLPTPPHAPNPRAAATLSGTGTGASDSSERVSAAVAGVGAPDGGTTF